MTNVINLNQLHKGKHARALQEVVSFDEDGNAYGGVLFGPFENEEEATKWSEIFFKKLVKSLPENRPLKKFKRFLGVGRD